MRVLSTTLAVMVLGLGASAQMRVFELDIPPPALKNEKAFETPAFTLKGSHVTDSAAHPLESRPQFTVPFSAVAAKRSVWSETTKDSAVNLAPNSNIDQKDTSNKFHWKPALIQSGMLLAIQHGFRFMTENKTRDELSGPFFRDWKESVRNLKGWDDGGREFTNYVAHPLQGAASSRIFINNSGKAKRQEFGKEGDYWEGRFKAMAWSAIFSIQFEIGPLSESSLGNVGQTLRPDGRSKQTYGDIVVTPLAGTGVVVLEDIIDKYVLDHWLEPRMNNRLMMKITRSLFTPSISFANLLRFRAPWRRDTRYN